MLQPRWGRALVFLQFFGAFRGKRPLTLAVHSWLPPSVAAQASKEFAAFGKFFGSVTRGLLASGKVGARRHRASRQFWGGSIQFVQPGEVVERPLEKIVR